MKPLPSNINPRSDSYQNNLKQMQAVLSTFHERMKQSREQGSDRYVKRHLERGKLLARDRVELILDQDTPFLELMPLAGYGQSDMTLGGSIVGGIGVVSGIPCMINASVPTLKGGALNQISVLKGQRLDVIADENHLPMIYLTESAGADLPQQSKVFNVGGAAFREITRRSKKGIPSLTVVFGNCTAGGAYIPGLSEYTIMVQDQAKVFLAGPPLVKMATNEEVDAETLGGALMHSEVSGVSDFLARTEHEGLDLARRLVSTWSSPSSIHSQKPYQEPKYNLDELLGVIPADVRVPVDPREIIARIVDASEFEEFKPRYGSSLVTGFAHIHGHRVGILSNQGVLFSESANKGCHFIQLCQQHQIPLIFLQNITGFMVGKTYEQGGIIKHGAKLINAITNSEVPAMTILTGASYGAGNYGMCGRSYQPRFLFAWPHSKLGVMGSDQLVGVMEMIQREKMAKAGKTFDEAEAAQIKAAVKKEIEKETDAYYATSRVWDDGVIDPRDTRHVLGLCLSVVNNNFPQASKHFGVFRM